MLRFILRLLARPVVLLAPVLILLARFSPYFHIKNKDGTPYMERYWVIFPRWITGGWGVRLHWIRTGDDDRALHDHPWDFGSIILRGGYFEIVYEADKWDQAVFYRDAHWPSAYIRYEPQTGKTVVGYYMRRGDVNVKMLDDWPWHRIRLLAELDGREREGTWTLFFCGPRKNGWGFRLPDGTKVPHREYIGKLYGKAAVAETDAALAKAWGGAKR